jgi:hypothetical protein
VLDVNDGPATAAPPVQELGYASLRIWVVAGTPAGIVECLLDID